MMLLFLFIVIFNVSAVSQDKGIENVKRYAVCYSKVKPTEAKDFDLLILDPDHYTKEELSEFKKLGIILIAYLNLAEFEAYRGYTLPDSLLLGENPIWENHFYIDVTSEVWRNLIFGEMIPKIISKEFDGFFLDMIDIVQIFPHFKEKIIGMVKLIKSQNPDKLVIANNGWVLIDTLKNFVDAFLVEGLFTRYDFKKGKYYVRFEKEYLDKVEILKKISKKIFTLDFLPENDKRRNYIKRLSLHYGFVPYISTIELNKIYK